MSQNHAVVIGGSIAGMCAAQALRTKFDTVTLVEQDEFRDGLQGRRGTPQAWHNHLLLDRGLEALESLFPGFTDHCVDEGAIIIDPSYEAALSFPGGWLPRARSDARTLFASRPKFETSIRDIVCRDPKITFIQNARVAGLTTSSRNGDVRVTGATYESPVPFPGRLAGAKMGLGLPADADVSLGLVSPHVSLGAGARPGRVTHCCFEHAGQNFGFP